MPTSPEELDPELTKLIQAQLEPGERVDGALQREGKASVRLIQQEMYDQLQEMPLIFNSDLGASRLLGAVAGMLIAGVICYACFKSAFRVPNKKSMSGVVTVCHSERRVPLGGKHEQSGESCQVIAYWIPRLRSQALFARNGTLLLPVLPEGHF